MEFRKVTAQDINKTELLFMDCLKDLLAREGIDEDHLLENEVMRLQDAVQKSFSHTDHLFFVAELNGEIIGTIALQPPGPLITSAVMAVPECFEVACVYVHPNFQKQGTGQFMFQSILQHLKLFGQSQYCLDAGFSSSQRYWKKALGEPSLVLENHWGEGKHHMIWQRQL